MEKSLTLRAVAELRLEYQMWLFPHPLAGRVSDPPWQRLSADYGVSRATIYKAVTGRSYKQIPMEAEYLEAWILMDDWRSQR